ncbi:MAG: type I restriction endonuclease subunit R, partial [Chloroflexota bacterium]|nr:type I restriction endonuclease subunit R [Chloroflexota bacterium]
MNESVVEEAVLHWFAALGWAVHYGPDIGPAGATPERLTYDDPVLSNRVTAALQRLNPDLPPAALAEARRKLTTEGQGSLLTVNKTVSAFLTDGVSVDITVDGAPRGYRVNVIDFADPANNDFLAVNQFTLIEGPKERRPDIVCFVNGLPVAVIELKDVGNPDADVWSAWNQLQTYQAELLRFFRSNVLMVASDGIEARMGAIGTPRERFAAWKTVDGDELASSRDLQLEVLIRGVFDPSRFLDLLRSFVLFEQDPHTEQIIKKIAQYHQYHAVRKAVASAITASRGVGERKGKGGVVWHTQGSGKSLTMLFFAGKLIQHPAMANPTIVMLTDRNDLDDQLFAQFARGAHLLRQPPLQVNSREELRDALRGRASGGVIFTTLQKFAPDTRGDRYPMLSDRSNIVVMADEAHRGQYDLLDGFAANLRSALPNATFVGFTGTPLELDDKDTRLVFGDYIDVYDIERAVEDGATVPIHYESRLIPLELSPGQAALLDDEFEEITEGNEEARTERAKSRWTQLEALVGAPKRLEQLAADLVEHFERRQAVQPGKAMVVAM